MAIVKTNFCVRGTIFEMESYGYITEKDLKLIRFGIKDAFALCEQDELHPSSKEFIDAISVYSNRLPQKIISLKVVL